MLLFQDLLTSYLKELEAKLTGFRLFQPVFYRPVTFLITGFMLSRRAGNTAAPSRKALSTMQVAVSVRMQSLVTTVLSYATSMTAISITQLASPVTL